MALHNVDVEVDFYDAAERTATYVYRLRQQFDDVANDWDDVITAADNFVTALSALSWSQISAYRVSMVGGQTFLAANIASNNQIRAFSRVQDGAGIKLGFEIPAWDDAVYDQDSNNLLSAAYNTAVLACLAFLKSAETDNNLTSVSWSQSRTRKSRNVLS